MTTAAASGKERTYRPGQPSGAVAVGLLRGPR